jgi:hypothetical protein
MPGRAEQKRRADKVESPAFSAALWAFVDDVQADRLRSDPPAEDAADFAYMLVGMFTEAIAQLHAASQGIGREQAWAKTLELVQAQRVLYGSLAAGDGEPPRP